MEQRSVGSDSCGNGICSIGVPTSSQICNISIMTTNEFGSSDNATARICEFKLLSGAKGL